MSQSVQQKYTHDIDEGKASTNCKKKELTPRPYIKIHGL